MPGEDSLHVAVEDGRAPAHAQRQDGTGGGTADAGQRLEVIEGVGHLVHYEKPVEAAAAIREFLA